MLNKNTKMKILTTIFVVFSISFLYAATETDRAIEKYYQEPSAENYMNALQLLQKNMDTTADDTPLHLKMAYLNLVEMQQNLDSLEANYDDLKLPYKFQYANLLLELDQYERALSIYEDLNEAAPKWSCPWRHKGEAYFKMDNLPAAEKALKKSIDCRKEHYDAYIMLADVQNEMGKYKEALETIETGFTYKYKDIEDPAEETVESNVQFLYLEILKNNNLTDKFNKQKEKVKKLFPEDTRLENY